MENTKEIIRTLINCAVEEIISLFAKNIKQLTFSDIVTTTQSAVNKLGTRIIEQIVNASDNVFNQQRDKHKIILRHTKTRRMISDMGELSLTRRLYYDKVLGRYFFAVDEMLGIEKYSRIEKQMKIKLISNATLTSYGKASKLSGNSVSRQTVCNLIKRIPEQELAVRYDGFKKIDKLYIEADEDHIHLNNGKSAEVKLVYVHEGRRNLCKGRTELINAKYFVAVRGGTDIWNSVADYVSYQYDVPKNAIRISGDGAAWIKSGLDFFCGAKYNIDKFHVYKSVTDASGGNVKFRRLVIDSIKQDDKNAVLKLYAEKWSKEQGASQRRRMADSLTYINNNFDDIELLSKCGCSAEGHVSHVLSERMSSRPMAWGVMGAEKMAQLRAFYFSGGDFSELKFMGKPADEKIKKTYNVLPMRKSAIESSVPLVHFLAAPDILEAIKKVLLSTANL